MMRIVPRMPPPIYMRFSVGRFEFGFDHKVVDFVGTPANTSSIVKLLRRIFGSAHIDELREFETPGPMSLHKRHRISTG
jgi:hypothetical protein